MRALRQFKKTFWLYLADARLFNNGSDEPYGPVIIVALIFLAVLVNFILRVNQR